MKKVKVTLLLIGLVLLLGGVVGAWQYTLLFPQPGQSEPTPVLPDKFFGWRFPVVKFPITGPGNLAYSDIRDPGGIPQGLPVRLQIPVIKVDAAIEDALITADGRMDVPAGSVDVAWFALGPHPGQEGSAVIGGHFGINNGVKFVFYDLDKLKVGDKIYILDDKNNTLAFVVRTIKLFDRNADATTVFTSHDGLAHLNLITCEGIWNRVNDSYPKRRVVFTDAITADGAVAPQDERIAPVVVPPALRLGARGVEVVTLQTALIQKGFLTMPRGVAKGYFGPLTRTAVAKYQASINVASNGVFDSLTRARLMSSPPPLATKPVLPSTALAIPTLASISTRATTQSQAVFRFVRDLFGTPFDALVTSLLLAAIAFVAFKIFRP